MEFFLPCFFIGAPCTLFGIIGHQSPLQAAAGIAVS